MTEKESYHVICAFRQESKVLAGTISDQLGVSSGLGNLKPFRVWLGGDFEWIGYPEIRIVFLTVRDGRDSGPAIPEPVEPSEAKSVEAKLIKSFENWEGMKDAHVYIEPAEKFDGPFWRGDENTMRALRVICLMQIDINFPRWLSPPEPEPEPASEPEPEDEPEPKRPDWPGIERPSRF